MYFVRQHVLARVKHLSIFQTISYGTLRSTALKCYPCFMKLPTVFADIFPGEILYSSSLEPYRSSNPFALSIFLSFSIPSFHPHFISPSLLHSICLHICLSFHLSSYSISTHCLPICTHRSVPIHLLRSFTIICRGASKRVLPVARACHAELKDLAGDRIGACGWRTRCVGVATSAHRGMIGNM